MPLFQSDLLYVCIKSYLKVGGGSDNLLCEVNQQKFKGNGKSECFLF